MREKEKEIYKKDMEGETKNISVQNFVDMDLPITVSLESKKQFMDSNDITYDHLEFEIQ